MGVLIILALLLCCSVIGLIAHFGYFWSQWPDVASFVEDSKCPACYGIDLCPAFYSGEIKIDTDFKSAIFNYVNAKNVYGGYNHKYGERAVVKKLAHNSELKTFDAKVCNMFGHQSECDFNKLVTLDLQDDITRTVEYDGHKSENGHYGLTVCPSTDGLHELIKPFMTNSTLDEKIKKVNVWTILSINPEPIILKFLNADSSLWPVPTYYGACGRTTLQQYGGKMLSTYLHRPWLYRAEIAIKLLHMANTFTFNHTRFRFYLSDISSDNIVLPDGDRFAGDPMVVDLEHVIVLDKKAVGPPSWSEVHSNEDIYCPDCFAFSIQALCSHRLSDFNIYSVCRLLEDEVLKDIPQFVIQKSPKIKELLSECVRPKRTPIDRFVAAKRLSEELTNILRVFTDNKLEESS